MQDVINSEYVEWLEKLITKIVETKPDKIGVCFTAENGEVYTSYYGDCYPVDKAVMAYWIHSDATMDTVVANTGMILDAANEELEPEDEEEE